jgi:tetratricopeptide (TPR) repeat protein
LQALASLNKELGKLEESREQLGRSLELFRVVGDVIGVADALHLLGVIAREAGRLEEALEQLGESLRLRKEAGDLWGVGTSLNDLAIAYAYLGQNTQAKDLFQQSLEAKREIGDFQGVAYAIANVGHFHHSLEEQITAQEESLALKRKLNDRQGIANSLNNLGGIYHQQQNYALAQARFIESVSLFLEIGNPPRLASVLVAYAHLLDQAGHPDQALRVVAAVDGWQAQPGNHLSPVSQDSFERLKQKGKATPVWQEAQPMDLETLARSLIGSAIKL